MTQTLASKDIKIMVQSSTTAHCDVVALVQSTIFGSDGLKYQRLEVTSQLDRLNDPTYFHATVGGELVGVYVLDKRDLQVGNRSVLGYYRGVLAVTESFQGYGVGKTLTKSARQWLAYQSSDVPVWTYGCIEQANDRSLKLLESGGAVVGSALSMYMMYRQWPSMCCDLAPLEGRHEEEINSLANELYGQCRIRDLTVSTLPGYVLQDESGVVISARVATTAFRIISMSTVSAWCTRLLVKPFEVARRRFNPERFTYLSLTEVVIKPGCERQWSNFVRSLLALHNCHFAMVYVDPTSELFARLQNSHPFNRYLHSAKGGVNVVWQVFKHTGSGDLQSDELSGPLQVWPVDA